jgi:hypothetical protein
MLFWRMHRAARIIFSLNFHLRKMTAQESIDYLRASLTGQKLSKDFTSKSEILWAKSGRRRSMKRWCSL